MLQLRGKPDLLLEPLGPQTCRDVRMENLESDRTVVTKILSEKDRREPATSELAVETILAAEYLREVVAYGQLMSPVAGNGRKSTPSKECDSAG